MTAPVWGDALDEVCTAETLLVVPTPAGRRSRRPTPIGGGEAHLVFACGRYEGIDQRVFDDAARRMRVEEVDRRLRPDRRRGRRAGDDRGRSSPDARCVGQSAVAPRDSHSGRSCRRAELHPPGTGATWKSAVCCPATTQKVAAWRREQSLRRTAQRRPDLLDRARVSGQPPTARCAHRGTSSSRPG